MGGNLRPDSSPTEVVASVHCTHTTQEETVEEHRGLVSDTATAVAHGFGAGVRGFGAHKVYNTVSGRLSALRKRAPKR
jgi:hypothetical protein